MLSLHQIHRHEYNGEDHKLAEQFAVELKKELDIFLKEVIFFGSAAKQKGPFEKIYETDIDVLIILDDLKKVLSNEVVEAYRVITEQTAAKVSRRFHINTLKISAFWEYLTNGDPIALNILREGKPLLNASFFRPLQVLLEQGRIRPSKENVWAYYLRAPQTILGAKWHILQATIDLYWAALDATHSALLLLGLAPNSPEHTEQLLKEALIKNKRFPKQYGKLLESLHQVVEDINERRAKEISGKTYDHLASATKEYVNFVKKWIANEKARVA